MDYELIKAIAKRSRLRVTDLIALAPQNDPFYVGTEGARREGEWFADLYHRFGAGRGVHVRRIHYQVVSQATPVRMPNGEPYENTEACWKFLSQASKRARYLHLVDADDFDDRRNAEPQDFAEWVDTDTQLGVRGGDWFNPDLPAFPEPPGLAPAAGGDPAGARPSAGGGTVTASRPSPAARPCSAICPFSTARPRW